MKTNVKIVGLGNRQTFKNKDGKDVEFVLVSICYKDDSMPVGYRAETIPVAPHKIPASLTVGEAIAIDIVRYRGKTRIRSIG